MSLEANLARDAAATGKPQLFLEGGGLNMGGGSNNKNWGIGGTAGAGMKVWQSDNAKHNVGVAGTYSQAAGRFQDQGFVSRPQTGIGFGYVFKF